jgi:hypothetical protein
VVIGILRVGVGVLSEASPGRGVRFHVIKKNLMGRIPDGPLVEG